MQIIARNKQIKTIQAVFVRILSKLVKLHQNPINFIKFKEIPLNFIKFYQISTKSINFAKNKATQFVFAIFSVFHFFCKSLSTLGPRALCPQVPRQGLAIAYLLRPPKRQRVAPPALQTEPGPEPLWQSQREVPFGPRTVEESDRWPVRIVGRLKDAHFLHPLQQVFESCVHLTTDYSGIGSAEEAMRCLLLAAAAAAQAEIPNGSAMSQGDLEELVEQRLLVQRCGDQDPNCRTVLLANRGCSAPHCVHGDIGERCSRRIWEETAELLANVRKSSAAQASLSQDSLATEIFAQFMQQELKNVSSYCYRHLQHCRLHQPTPTSSGSSCSAAVQAERTSTSSHDSNPFEQVEDLNHSGSPAPLRLHIAGFSCVDWSNMGSKQGWIGHSTLSFMQWLAERTQFEEDIVICEKTVAFDLDTLVKLTPKFQVDTLTVSPTLIGEPVERRRLYIILLLKKRRRWSRVVPQNKQGLFDQLFKARPFLTPTAKFRAPQDQVSEFVAGLAAKQLLPPVSRSGRAWSCFQAVSGPVRRQIQEHEIARAEEAKKKSDTGVEDAEDSSMWVTNLAQSAQYMKPVYGQVPALLRKSNLWLFGPRRLALPQEHLECQGWNLFGAGPFVNEASKEVFQTMTHSCLKSFAGNSMHLHAVGAVIAFTLACTENVNET